MDPQRRSTRHYSAFLTWSPSKAEQNDVQELVASHGIHADVASGYIELEHEGSDTNRYVVPFLRELAVRLKHIDGEIVCEEKRSGHDPRFEFYRIENATLLRQDGTVVRGKLEQHPRPDEESPPEAEPPDGEVATNYQERPIREYSGVLCWDAMAASDAGLRALAGRSHIRIDVANGWTEVKHKGPDTGRSVVGFLFELAALVKKAEGEVTCREEMAGKDPHFEFYSIDDATLWCQEGDVIRGPVQNVSRESDRG